MPAESYQKNTRKLVRSPTTPQTAPVNAMGKPQIVASSIATRLTVAQWSSGE